MNFLRAGASSNVTIEYPALPMCPLIYALAVKLDLSSVEVFSKHLDFNFSRDRFVLALGLELSNMAQITHLNFCQPFRQRGKSNQASCFPQIPQAIAGCCFLHHGLWVPTRDRIFLGSAGRECTEHHRFGP